MPDEAEIRRSTTGKSDKNSLPRNFSHMWSGRSDCTDTRHFARSPTAESGFASTYLPQALRVISTNSVTRTCVVKSHTVRPAVGKYLQPAQDLTLFISG